MKNYVKGHGELTYKNTTGSAIVSGDVVPLTNRISIANGDIANDETGMVWTIGQFSLKKKTSDVIAQDAKVYWDTTNKEITTTVGSNKFAGLAATAQLSGDTKVTIDINQGAA